MSAFVDAITGARVPVIAEVKLRDAAGTDLLGGRSVAEVVRAYREAGAACVSVVTGRWFGGNAELLREVASLIDVPLLQKDFITSQAQLRQARQLGASAVLLTAALLPAATLPRVVDRALALGLTPFVEVTGAGELPADASACVIAVNNKDIKDRERGSADLGRGLGLLPAVLATGTPCAVSASGIDTPETGARLVDAGFAALLVGTGLLRASSPRAWFDRFAHARTAA
ncbi:indole-3-glycerol-phosphate synthase [Lentzea albidocapillata]|uniref:indole-3-glycerol-phosphate synthase n=1 Tax=Lentzea albidocapillata TaxID=40571 RepID=A0A1W1ZQM4_9PSEU|nr:indole-3-glycerol-phosphate synthase [Lentzea albidocapillata]SMC50694.1 indole-3-glycerol phosphate synthase [Lentzea albidocapillata]